MTRKMIVVENCVECPYCDTSLHVSGICLKCKPRYPENFCPVESVRPDCPLTDLPDVGKMVEDEAVKFAVWLLNQKMNSMHKGVVKLYKEYHQSKKKP